MSGGRWTRGPLNECIEVSPVYFFDGQKGSNSSSEVVVGSNDDNNDDDKHSSPIAVMAVHFWSCDDHYGSPVTSTNRGGGAREECTILNATIREEMRVYKQYKQNKRTVRMPNRSHPQFTTCNNQRCGGHVTICTIKQYTNKTKHYPTDAEHVGPSIYNMQQSTVWWTR